MALLLLPVALAKPPLTDARLTFTSASFAGNVESLGAVESFLFLPPDEEKQVNVSIRASNLLVNWTEIGWYHVTDPRDPQDSDISVQKGPGTQGEKDHGPGTATSHLQLASANLLLVGSGENLPKVNFGALAATVQANPHGHWIGGSMSRTTAGQTDPQGTVVQIHLPAGASQTELRESSITVTGNLTIYLWDTWLNVTDQDGHSSYHAGQEFASTATPGAPARESLSRLLTLRLTNAEISITLDAGRALVVSQLSSIKAIGEARLNSALGTVNGHAVLDEPIDIQGEFRLESTNQSTNDQRMRGLLSYRADTTSVTAGTANIAAPTSPNRPISPWWLAIAAVPMLLIGTVAGIRRYGPVTLDDVEYAILAGHDRRAHSSARRLAKKTPRDPDAVFLYATTLLQRKNFGPLVEKIEPLAAQIPKPERRGIAFVLAVASHALGDKQRSAKWGAEAAREPLLAQKLEESGLGPFKPTPSRFTQSGYA